MAKHVASKQDTPKRKEADLYAPVKGFFELRGYTVRGEVQNCDLLAMRDDHLIAVELKTACNLTLILQAVARLSVADAVYIAFPHPQRKQLPLWRELLKLCKRSGIGLLTVTFLRDGAFVTEHVPGADARQVPASIDSPGSAASTNRNTNRKRRQALVREALARPADFNVGGTNNRKRMTAYRQLSLLCAAEIAHHGTRSPKQLRDTFHQEKITPLLRANVYHWFARVSRGLYELTAEGKQALIDYADVLQALRLFEYNSPIDETF